jgi:tetratricopeptide (TPR) repeat protein
MQYIRNHGRPSNKVYLPGSEKEVNLYGLMAVLAAATSLSDIDVLGGSGANCGMVVIKDKNGVIIGTHVVKIDPGEAFRFEGRVEYENLFIDKRDIRYATGTSMQTMYGFIIWKNLTEEQQQEFLEVKRNSLLLSNEDIFHYLFYRNGQFNHDHYQPMDEFKASEYRQKLIQHLNNQADIYSNDLANFEEQRESYLKVLAKKMRKTAVYDRALNYYEKLVDVYQPPYGDKNSLAFIYNEIAKLYEKNGDYHRSKKYAEYAYKVWQTLGEVEQLNSTRALINLGLACFRMSENEDATRYAHQCLNQLLPIAGDHRRVAKTFNLLGLVYNDEGDYVTAQEYHEKALEIRRVALGENHPDVAGSYNSLGNVYISQEDYVTAQEYHEKALAIRREALGENHPDVARSYYNLGIMCHHQGDEVTAQEYFEKATEIRLAVLGGNHVEVAISYHLLGIVCFSQGDYLNARGYLEKALAVRLAVLDEDHPDVVECYHDLGEVCESQGDYPKAIEYNEKIFSIFSDVDGEDDLMVTESCENLGRLYASQGEYPRALRYYEKSLAIWLSQLEEYPSQVALNYENVGNVYNSQGDYLNAREYHEKSLALWLIEYDENHPNVVESYSNLGDVCYSLEDYPKALEYYDKAYRLQLTQAPNKD